MVTDIENITNENIYLLKHDNLYKLGYSKDIKNRFKVYQQHNPSIKFIKAVYLIDGKNIEKNIHKHNHSVYRNEWYTEDVIFDIWEKMFNPIILFKPEILLIWGKLPTTAVKFYSYLLTYYSYDFTINKEFKEDVKKYLNLIDKSGNVINNTVTDLLNSKLIIKDEEKSKYYINKKYAHKIYTIE